MPKLTLTVPWQYLCSDNRKYVAMGVLSPQYREAKQAVGLVAMAAAKKGKWTLPQGALTLTVSLWEPDHRKRDILNHAKMLCDAITASEKVWIDDSQIAHATFVREGTDKANPRAVITVEVQ